MRCLACNEIVKHSDNSDYCRPCHYDNIDDEDDVKFYCLEDAEEGVTIPPTSMDYKTHHEDIE